MRPRKTSPRLSDPTPVVPSPGDLSAGGWNGATATETQHASRPAAAGPVPSIRVYHQQVRGLPEDDQSPVLGVVGDVAACREERLDDALGDLVYRERGVARRADRRFPWRSAPQKRPRHRGPRPQHAAPISTSGSCSSTSFLLFGVRSEMLHLLRGVRSEMLHFTCI